VWQHLWFGEECYLRFVTNFIGFLALKEC